jgi:sulfite exporter TauE/SafE
MLLWFCLLSFALGTLAAIFAWTVVMPAIRVRRFSLNRLLLAIAIAAAMLGIWFWLRELLPKI